MKSLFLSLVLVVYLLTAQALATDINVAVVHVGAVDQFSAADYPDSLNKYGIQNVISFLVDDGRFGLVDSIDVDQEGAPPTLEQLLNYDAIMVVTDGWGTDSPFPSEILTGGGLGTQLGNVLDDYVLDGGRVVFTAYCGDLEYGIDGEILDFGLAPYEPQGVNFDDPCCLDMADANLAHPVFENVSGFCPSYSSEINLQAPPGERLGRFLNGDECVLTTASDSIVGADAVMFVNGYPGTLADIQDVNNPDFEVLFANALALSKVPSNQIPDANAGDNIQISSANQAYTVVQGTGTDPDGDPLEYSWTEVNEAGEVIQLLLDWSPVGDNNEAYLDLGALPYFSIGTHFLRLDVNDSQLTSSDEMILTVDNSPPDVMPAPSYQVVEIGIDPIVVVADVADFDGDTISYEWLKNSEVLAFGSVETVQGGGTVPIPDLEIGAGDPRFPLGVHVIEVKVSDEINDTVSAFVSVEVTDTSGPSLGPIPSKTILWPPNHKFHSITIWANAFDNGGGAITLHVEVISSEPEDGIGDGNTEPDYYIDDVNDATGVIELRLRAERSGKGDGRTYTINITATDESGNVSVAMVEISAPHDRRKK